MGPGAGCQCFEWGVWGERVPMANALSDECERLDCDYVTFCLTSMLRLLLALELLWATKHPCSVLSPLGKQHPDEYAYPSAELH